MNSTCPILSGMLYSMSLWKMTLGAGVLPDLLDPKHTKLAFHTSALSSSRNSPLSSPFWNCPFCFMSLLGLQMNSLCDHSQLKMSKWPFCFKMANSPPYKVNTTCIPTASNSMPGLVIRGWKINTTECDQKTKQKSAVLKWRAQCIQQPIRADCHSQTTPSSILALSAGSHPTQANSTKLIYQGLTPFLPEKWKKPHLVPMGPFSHICVPSMMNEHRSPDLERHFDHVWLWNPCCQVSLHYHRISFCSVWNVR